MKECKICHSTEKIVFHHLSYDPEIGIDVCQRCHHALHLVDIESLEKIIKLKKEFGHLWINGSEQYSKSKRRIETKRAYAKSDYAKEMKRKYYYSDHGKEVRKKYEQSSKRIERRHQREKQNRINKKIMISG